MKVGDRVKWQMGLVGQVTVRGEIVSMTADGRLSRVRADGDFELKGPLRISERVVETASLRPEDGPEFEEGD